MSPSNLSSNAYGKSSVRLVKIVRPRAGESGQHRLWDLAVNVQLVGADGIFDSAYIEGDNSRVLPTDTMKNTVYAVARLTEFDAIETLAVALARHFQERNAHLASAEVTITQRAWDRIGAEDEPHDYAFESGSGEQRIAVAKATASSLELRGGFYDLRVLKTTGSGFSGFPRDEFTTLVDAQDRILATTISARWLYLDSDYPADRDLNQLWFDARSRLLAVFAEHESLSVQHTLYAMGQAVLDQQPKIAEVHLSLPNQHHFPVDLSAFGLDNPDEIFLAVDEPYGLIEGTVRRR